MKNMKHIAAALLCCLCMMICTVPGYCAAENVYSVMDEAGGSGNSGEDASDKEEEEKDPDNLSGGSEQENQSGKDSSAQPKRMPNRPGDDH